MNSCKSVPAALLAALLAAVLGLGCGGSGRGGGPPGGEPDPDPGSVVVPSPIPEGAEEIPEMPEPAPPMLADQSNEFAARIFSRDGQPLEDYEITVDGEPVVTVTDDQGNFLVEALEPGTHRVSAVRQGVTIADFEIEVSGQPENRVLLSTLCEIGADEGVNRTDPRFFEVHRFLGEVTGENGMPLEDAEVVVFTREGFFQRDFTGADGSYRMVGDIRSGELQIAAFAEGYRPEVRDLEINTKNLTTDFRLEPRETGTVNGQINLGQFQSGRVSFVSRLTEDETGPNTVEELGSDGTFSFEAPAGVGILEVLVETEQGYMGFSGSIAVSPDSQSLVNVQLRPVTPEGLGGSLMDGQGQPVSGATVELRDGNEVLSTATTDSNGEYLFSDPPKGVFQLRASRAGQTAATPVVVRRRLNPRKTLRLGTQASFTRVAGIVRTREEDGGLVPVAGASLQARRVSDSIPVSTATSRADGSYSLVVPRDELEMGQIQLRVFKQGFNELTPVLDLGAELAVSKNFQLERLESFPHTPENGTVTGRVLDRSEGFGLSNAQVAAFSRPRPGEPYQRVGGGISSADGSFELTGLPTERQLLIRARVGSRKTGLETVTVMPGGTGVVNFELPFGEPDTTPTVQVETYRRDGESSPINGVTATVMTPDGEELANGETNAFGIIRLDVENLPAEFLVEVGGAAVPTRTRRVEYNPDLPELNTRVTFGFD